MVFRTAATQGSFAKTGDMMVDVDDGTWAEMKKRGTRWFQPIPKICQCGSLIPARVEKDQHWNHQLPVGILSPWQHLTCAQQPHTGLAKDFDTEAWGILVWDTIGNHETLWILGLEGDTPSTNWCRISCIHRMIGIFDGHSWVLWICSIPCLDILSSWVQVCRTRHAAVHDLQISNELWTDCIFRLARFASHISWRSAAAHRITTQLHF